ncbi:MAG: hypothetical protein FWE40_05335 [Oscillospiraceae bacterium]|nr:hypothetical protein [Oscillospiraceae bacterium]
MQQPSEQLVITREQFIEAATKVAMNKDELTEKGGPHLGLMRMLVGLKLVHELANALFGEKAEPVAPPLCLLTLRSLRCAA